MKQNKQTLKSSSIGQTSIQQMIFTKWKKKKVLKLGFEFLSTMDGCRMEAVATRIPLLPSFRALLLSSWPLSTSQANHYFYFFAPQAFFYPLPISISLHLVTSSASLSPSPPCVLMQVKGAGEERGRWVHSRVSATAPSQRVKKYEQRRSGRLRDIE